MNQEQELKNEAINTKVATLLGWTDIHGGLADGGMYLRGHPPGAKSVVHVVPNFLVMEAKGYFITNEADRPFEEHITKKNEDGSLNYIHPRLAHIPTFHNMRFPDATPVADFGVLLLELDGDLVGVVIGESVVTYKHGRSEGKPRQWQGRPHFSFPLPKPERSGDNGLRWHKLTEEKSGTHVIGVMGATCIDGIGVIANWERIGEGWEVTVIDTESGEWGPRLDTDETEIPEQPPTIWDDRN